MASIQNVTREAIERAIAEFDAIGEEAFHAKHGTAPSTKHVLRQNGREYPSKAIVAAASGLSPKDFSGGTATVGRLFKKLGFTLGQLAFAFAAMAASSGPAEASEVAELPVRPVYFASGSNRAPEIRGFARVGQAIGVAATELATAGENALHALASTGLPVFVDSGAFSEVEFSPETGGFVVAHPYTAAQWRETLDLYARLAATLGSQLYVVAPDRVGSQEETLERLALYREEMRAIRSQGANIIVVAQKGTLSQAAFDVEAERVIGFGDYVRGLPCKKAATSVEEIAAFVAARKPARVHLLGLGERNRNADRAIDLVRRASPSTVVSMDSNLLRANVGQGRKVTVARTLAARLLETGKAAASSVLELAIVLAFGALQLNLLPNA